MMTETSSKRLSRGDWIEAAITVMVASSVEQVRVEKLAVDLGASKGSFYWHFKDRGDLLAAVLAEWQFRSSHAVEQRITDSEPSAKARILHVMQLPFRSQTAARAAELELAIMGWARRWEPARIAVEAVDQARTNYLQGLFSALGLPPNEAAFRTHQAYAFLRYVAQRHDMAREERQQLVGQLHARLTGDCGELP